MILNDFILKAIKANKKYCQTTGSVVDITKGFKVSGNEITIPTGISEVKITVWGNGSGVIAGGSYAYLNGVSILRAYHVGNASADAGTTCAVKIVSVAPADVIRIDGNGIVETL